MSLVEYTPPTGPTGNHWVDLVAPAAELAKSIAGTEFVPNEMRGKPAAVAACILYGSEIGIGPMQALAKIDIVKGRPAPKAELARALALAAGHEVWVEESTNTRVTVAGRRRNSEHVQKVTWTLDDVKKAGIVNQAYGKYPRQMLLARASAELVRMMCPDALGGIGQFSEEVDDGEPGNVTAPVTATVEARGNTRQRRPLAIASGPLESPPLPGEDEAPTPPQDTPSAPAEPAGYTGGRISATGITDAQMRKLQALLAQKGYRDRASAIDYVSTTIGRTVASRNELSKAEGISTIDALEQLPDVAA